MEYIRLEEPDIGQSLLSHPFAGLSGGGAGDIESYDQGLRTIFCQRDCLSSHPAACLQNKRAWGKAGIPVQQPFQGGCLILQPGALPGVVAVNIGIFHQ